MNKLAILGFAALAISACQTKAPVEVMDTNTTVDVSTPATTATTQAASDTEIAMVSEPVTVSGGSGSTCLAVDVLANDGAFIRAGTAGTLSGDTFTVNGASHDISGINYSVKPC